ncbi:MAG: PTS sugar transporter subunit IIA [Candidatus Omnitrophica bacterium]|nr:PTS sugar transporter subunit IIA [Candidatus Omnitrophota bacterium]
MKVSEYLKKNYCVMDLNAADKEAAVREIAEELTSSGKVADKAKFIEDILERESLGSTGIGHKVAIPHARTASIKGFVIGFGKSKEGIDFNALDGEKVNLIFLMGADPRELNLYLRVLAELSKLLMNSAFREALVSAESADQVIQIIRQFEK